MSIRRWAPALAVTLPLLGASPVIGYEKEKKAPSFGVLKAPSVDAARGQAMEWLKSVGKADEIGPAVDALWKQTDRTLLDLVSNTLVLADTEAATLLSQARDPSGAAPTELPAFLKDTQRPAFYRANLALAYAKALSNRRVFEETLEVLKTIKPEQVVDPAAYFFHRAVAEHALTLKAEANRSITGLLEDVVEAPDRYKFVGLLMHYDMQSWKDKDLGAVARKMDNVERRLELSRGGPHTQKIQKEIVARLDEIIKELENQAKGSSQCNNGGCPNGGQPGNGGGNQPNTPMQDSQIAGASGPGNVDAKKLKGLAEAWGKMPEKERAKALQDIIKDMPPRHREITENYFKKLAKTESNQP
jgi:hypothetical protein